MPIRRVNDVSHQMTVKLVCELMPGVEPRVAEARLREIWGVTIDTEAQLPAPLPDLLRTWVDAHAVDGTRGASRVDPTATFAFRSFQSWGYGGVVTGAGTVIARVEDRVRREPAFAELLAALVDLPAGSAGEYARSAAAALNRRRGDDALAEFKAGSLSTAEVQRLLGVGTPQAVHQLRRRHKVIGLQAGNATWFPAWQFEPGRLRPDLPRILADLARFTTDPVAADRVMRLVRDDLGGVSISEALDDARSARQAWVVLGALGA